MLTLIGIFIFVLAESLFNYSSVGGSTNWSIFYFVSTYLSIVLVSADLLFRETSKAIRFSGLSIGVFFVVLIIIELIHINVPFNEYIISVSEGKIKFVLYGLLAIVFIYISLLAWEKRLLKK
jgi:hypothetical protein